VEIPWRNTMGVLHPGVPQCSLPLLAPVEAAAANAAVAPAAAAAREALEAAVAYSAAERSYRVLEAELRATDRRRRGIEHHRLPALEEALRRLELRLDELEHEEGVVRRWAKGRQEV
jgi:vacuolar-type H+-ATPase subunit D/Vma8